MGSGQPEVGLTCTGDRSHDLSHMVFVDDDRLVLESLRRILRRRSQAWTMDFCKSAQEALDLLERRRIDVLMTDLGMPGMDGIELLRRVQESHPRVVRLVFSGRTDDATAAHVLSVAHQSISKPSEPARLFEVLERACKLSEILSRDDIRVLGGGLERPPAQPEFRSALTTALSLPDASTRNVAAIIEQDTAMTARVLHLVNSAFFGLGGRASSVHQAVCDLGPSTIQMLILAAEIFGAFQLSEPVPGFSLPELDRRSAHAGRIAYRLLEARSQSKAESAVIAAILCDVGQLVLAAQQPEYFAGVIAEARQRRCAIQEVELERTNVTHAEVGAYLLGVWGLRLTIAESVAFHHTPSQADEPQFDIVGAVHVASALADEMNPTVPNQATPYIDVDYLERVGETESLGRWREVAQATVS